MTQAQITLKRWLEILLISLAPISYFLFLRKYYFFSYEIPDYFLYYDFGLQGLPARDGFSSLFILIASKLVEEFWLIHFSMLVLMTSSLTLFCLGFFRMTRLLIARIIFILFIFSMGSWWYFYGKIFYEFPFIAFTYSIIFCYTAKFLTGEKDLAKYLESKFNYLKFCAFLFLTGFCLSWKMHAIFPLMGLVLLIIIRQSDLKKFFKPSFFLWPIIFFLGYMTGNFRLLTSPLETIQGIRGYKSGSNPIEFFFNDASTVWDHINLLSFNTAIIHWIPALFLLFIAPIFMRHGKKVLILNAFLICLFIFFIYKFLPGLTWQGFPFSLYFIPLVGLLIYDTKPQNFSVLTYVMVAATIQFINNFFIYVPQQLEWVRATNEAVEVLYKNSSLISGQIQNFINKYGPNYSINLTLKRKLPESPPLNIIEVLQKTGSINIAPSNCFGDCNRPYVINIEPTSLYRVRSYQPLPPNPLEVIHNPDYLISITR